MLLISALPALLLLALSGALFHWRKPAGTVTALSFSLGLTLLVVPLMVVVGHSSASLNPLLESPSVLLGIAILVYVGSLATVSWRARIPLLRVALVSVLGAAALYPLAGFVLMSSACSFGSGGC